MLTSVIPYIPHIYRSNGQTDEASQDDNDSTDMSDDNNNTMAQEATSEAFPPTKTAVTESTPLTKPASTPGFNASDLRTCDQPKVTFYLMGNIVYTGCLQQRILTDTEI